MAAYLIPDAGANMAPLTGSNNYLQWSHEFEIACQYRGIWRLFTGEEQVKEVQERLYERNICIATSDDKVQRLVDERAEARKQSREHLQKTQYALAFIGEKVDPKIRAGARDWSCPFTVWRLMEKKYKVKESALDLAWKWMETIYQKDCTSLGQYLLRIKEGADGIKALDGEFSDDDCKLYIVSGLEPEYISHLIKHGLGFSAISNLDLAAFGEELVQVEAALESYT